jgi:hypothetical protein
VEGIHAILGDGVMSTPGVVIDGSVVHAGGVPNAAGKQTALVSLASQAAQ